MPDILTPNTTPEIPAENTGKSLPPIIPPSPQLPPGIQLTPPEELLVPPTPQAGQSISSLKIPTTSGFPLKKVLIFSFIGIFSFTFLGFGLMYAIAYEKININNPTISQPIGSFVIGLPFAPKTPLFVAQSAITAHKASPKNKYDTTLTVRSIHLTELYGSNTMELKSAGAIDYTTLERVRFNGNLTIGADFGSDIRSDGTKFYFKVNKLPLSLLSPILGIPEEDFTPLIQDWVTYDYTSLQTDYSKYAHKQESGRSLSQDSDRLLQLIQSDFVADQVTLTEDTLNNKATHRLHFAPPPASIDQIGVELGKIFPSSNTFKSRLSNTIKSFTVDLYIDKTDYHLLKTIISLSASISTQSATPQTSTSPDTTIVFTQNTSDFGKEIVLDLPPSFITTSQLSTRISNKLQEISTLKALKEASEAAALVAAQTPVTIPAAPPVPLQITNIPLAP